MFSRDRESGLNKTHICVGVVWEGEIGILNFGWVAYLYVLMGSDSDIGLGISDSSFT